MGRKGAVILGAASLAVLAGATVQALAAVRERDALRPVGRLVDLGDRSVHLWCEGEGSPTVLLEAGPGGTAAEWAWVIRDLAGTTRVCSYDRAGLGLSDAVEGPRDLPAELSEALDRALVPGPYVIAGRSLGATMALAFAARHEGEIAGAVLVDPGLDPGESSLLRLAPALAQLGWMRIAAAGDALPLGAADLATFAWRDPGHLSAASAELRLAGSLAAQAASADLSGVPLLVIGTGGDEQRALAARSESGRIAGIETDCPGRIVVEREPARQVSRAIEEVITEARLRGSMAQNVPFQP